MRILIGECLPRELVGAFRAELIQTVPEAGLASLEDGALLDAMSDRFDVFITIDRSLRYQQRLDQRSFGTVAVRAASNRIEAFLPHFATLRDAAFKVKAGQVLRLDLRA